MDDVGLLLQKRNKKEHDRLLYDTRNPSVFVASKKIYMDATRLLLFICYFKNNNCDVALACAVAPQLNDELKAVEAKHQAASGSVGDLTDALSALSDELQELKEKMDSKGDTVRAITCIIIGLAFFFSLFGLI